MKAKHFVYGDNQEIVLETGKRFKSLPREQQGTFSDRIIAKIYDEELDELEITLINMSRLEKLSDERAIELYEQSSGLEQEMLEELLTNRDLIITDNSNNQNSNTVEENTAKVAPKKGKVQVKNTDAEAAPKGKVAAKANAEPKAKKEPAEKPAPQTKEERAAAIEAFKQTETYTKPQGDIGKEVVFSTKHTEHGKGVIKSLSINKTLTKVYYTVLNHETKKRECVTLDNVEFVK